MVGFVEMQPSKHGFIAGRFLPGPAFATYRDRFELAVASASIVDHCEANQYHEAWHVWKTACDSLQEAAFSFGYPPVPIEGFTIDSDWMVEFETALWSDVEQEMSRDG
jgi:hypothetical protein